MKNLFLVLAMIMAFSFPAVADDNMTKEIQNSDYTSLEQAIALEEDSGDEKAFYRCYAKPRALGWSGYTYVGTGFNRWQASRTALRNCQYGLRRVNWWASRYGCYMSHCFRFFK